MSFYKNVTAITTIRVFIFIIEPTVPVFYGKNCLFQLIASSLFILSLLSLSVLFLAFWLLLTLAL